MELLAGLADGGARPTPLEQQHAEFLFERTDLR